MCCVCVVNLEPVCVRLYSSVRLRESVTAICMVYSLVDGVRSTLSGRVPIRKSQYTHSIYSPSIIM